MSDGRAQAAASRGMLIRSGWTHEADPGGMTATWISPAGRRMTFEDAKAECEYVAIPMRLAIETLNNAAKKTLQAASLSGLPPNQGMLRAAYVSEICSAAIATGATSRDKAIEKLIDAAIEIDACFKLGGLGSFGTRASKARLALGDAIKGVES